MSLAKAIVGTVRKGPVCSFRTMRDGLDPDQQAELDACMNDVSMTSAGISRGLGVEWDIRIGAYTVNRHRSGLCSCAPR